MTSPPIREGQEDTYLSTVWAYLALSAYLRRPAFTVELPQLDRLESFSARCCTRTQLREDAAERGEG